MIRPVPVLMYHHINPHKGDTVTVTPEVFEEQMKHLKKRGYRTLAVSELKSYIKGDLALDQRSVVVTFDDGWLDNYLYAYPVLKKYKINAVIFLITDRVEKASETFNSMADNVPTHEESKELINNGEIYKVALNWQLINKMRESGLVEFYSHTRSHKKCDGITVEELRDELAGSKELIERRLEKSSPYFCWPYGNYNETSLRIAKEAGYQAVFTTDHGVVKAGSDPYMIKRILIRDDAIWFKKRMFIYTNPVFSELYLKVRKR